MLPRGLLGPLDEAIPSGLQTFSRQQSSSAAIPTPDRGLGSNLTIAPS